MLPDALTDSFETWRGLSRGGFGLLLMINLLVVSACVVTDGGDVDLPSATAPVAVSLDPKDSQTFEFDVKVEVLVNQEGFRVFMEPSPQALESEGIRVEQSWVENGITEEGWPEGRLLVQGNDPLSAKLVLTLVNSTENSFTRDVTVTIAASPINVSGPTDDDLKLSIIQD
jgi:hypothetical protein